MEQTNSTVAPVEGADHLDKFAAEAAAVDKATNVTPEPVQVEGSAADDVEKAVFDNFTPVDEPTEPLMSAEEEAAQVVGLAAFAAEKIWPVLQYQEEVKTEAAKKLAPLMKKYKLGDSIFAKYGAEVEAGMFFGGLIYASVLAVRASKQPPEPVEEPPKKHWWNKFFAKSVK